MSGSITRNDARRTATHRGDRIIEIPTDNRGECLKVSQYYGENIFDFQTADGIPGNIRKEILEVSSTNKKLTKDLAEIVATAVTEWATQKGATHFCHWFQPLTGSTAEKHDAFLSLDKDGRPIERLSANQLMQGEPDASSFPNGGSRATFEARGYTAWDLSSPMFLMESVNGKTLCIPTAFVSYTGEALDVKTPLLRSISKLNESTTKFLKLIGMDNVKKVNINCGAEQEYFLVDKAFYNSRPDLVMTGRTLFGSMAHKNQQLDDHYFGDISDRVMSFMQELDLELYRLGIPAKTRHNEVAPGQYEIAPIFNDANVAADNNQTTMAIIKKVAERHKFKAILHEKPFAGINGSGKHINWSMSSDTGINLLNPGDAPHENTRFLTVLSVVIEAVYRHGGMLRAAIASAGNDHRLGANEAPPSVISVFLGENLEGITKAIIQGKEFSPSGTNHLEMGAEQLSHLKKDNTDRNRTSPFAFTGNRFEFRAVGSDQNIGFPMSILNAAVSEVFDEVNITLEAEITAGKKVDEAMLGICKKLLTNSQAVVFNGDGYSDEWLKEAEKRGLPNLRTTADALPLFISKKDNEFLTKQEIYSTGELEMRYNVLLERYITLRQIEFGTLIGMVNQNVIQAIVDYKLKLGTVIKTQKDCGLECSVETEMYKRVNFEAEKLFTAVNNLSNSLDALPEDELKRASSIATELLPLSEVVANSCAELEEMIPDSCWTLPKYYEMLFMR